MLSEQVGELLSTWSYNNAVYVTQKVSMTGKCHSHILQHHEEETKFTNSHMTSKDNQLSLSLSLSLSLFPGEMNVKVEMTLRTAQQNKSQTHTNITAKGVCLNAFY